MKIERKKIFTKSQSEQNRPILSFIFVCVNMYSESNEFDALCVCQAAHVCMCLCANNSCLLAQSKQCNIASSAETWLIWQNRMLQQLNVNKNKKSELNAITSQIHTHTHDHTHTLTLANTTFRNECKWNYKYLQAKDDIKEKKYD